MKQESQHIAPPATLWQLLQRIHHDEKGGVSIETVLIIAAIALPILIFILKFAWPYFRDEIFWKAAEGLKGEAEGAAGRAGGR